MQGHLSEFGRAKDELMLFGLSEKEALVYLTLLTFGELRAAEVASHLTMHRLDVYKTLNSLQAKDMVQATISKPMKFAAAPIRHVLGMMKNNLRLDIKTKTDALLDLQKTGEKLELYAENNRSQGKVATSNKIQIISGRKAVEEKWRQLLARAQREILVAAADKGSARTLLFRDMDLISRKMKLGVKVKIFTPVNNSNVDEFQGLTSEVRHLSSSNSAGFCVVDRKQAMILPESPAAIMTRENSAILTDSPSIVEMLSVLFFEGWNTGPLIGDSVVTLENGI